MNKKLIVILLVVLAVAVAGCIGDGGTAPEGNNGGDGDGGADGGSDGGADGSDGGTSDGDGMGDGGTGDGADGGSGDGGMDDGGTGDGGMGDGNGGTGGSVTFREAFGDNVVTQQFAFDIETKGDEQVTISGRFYDGDMYMQFDSQQGSGEFYIVGNTQYTVMQGTCFTGGQMAPSDETQIEPGEYESEVSEYADLTPTGTTTIDGEQMYVFELTSDMAGQSDMVTYYVGVNSGNLRRVETQDAVVNFHSWNDVDAVEAPDMNCQDMSQGSGMPSGSMPSGGM